MRIRHAKVVLLAAALAACPACMMPGIPAAPVAGPPTLDGVALAPAAGPPPAPPSGLEKCCDALDKCRRKLCETPFGQMLNSMTKPVSAMTGGLIPTFCPGTPGLDDLAKAGVAGESAAVQKDAAEAKARRGAVRVLGTVDCRYYPDVEPKLLAALRSDGSECVRYEAALALSHGCCCSKKVIEILTISVAGGEEDGAPAERSERVRDTAADALARCISCVKVLDDPAVLPDPKGDGDGEIEGPKKKLPAKDDDTKPKPNVNKADKKTVAKAREVLAQRQAAKDAVATVPVPPTQVHSVYEMFKYANDGPVPPAPPMPTAPAAVKPVPPSTLSVARPVNPLRRDMPTTTGQAPAIQATVMPESARMIPTGPITPVQAPADPVEMPPAPMPEVIPVAVPPMPETAVVLPAIPEAPAVPAIPALPTVELPAEPTVQAPAAEPAVQPLDVPPVTIQAPMSPAAPLPTSPFPD